MKKLNLKLFAVSVLLAVTFASLPPYQAQAVMARPDPAMIKKYLQEYLVKEGVDISNVNMDALCADPAAIYKIKTAQKSIKEFADKMYLYYGSDATVQISTNAPAGFNPSTPIGQPVVLGNYDANGGIIIPHVTLLLLCVEIVIVVIILGVAYYITVKVCKWIKNVLSNSEWQATNDTISYIPPIGIASTSSGGASSAKGHSSLTATSIPSTLPILIPNNNSSATYSFLIQSSADMNTWSTDYTVTINNNLVATMYDSNNNPLSLQSVGNTSESGIGYSYRQSATVTQAMEKVKSFRLQFIAPTNGYTTTNFYPNIFTTPVPDNIIAIPPVYR